MEDTSISLHQRVTPSPHIKTTIKNWVTLGTKHFDKRTVLSKVFRQCDRVLASGQQEYQPSLAFKTFCSKLGYHIFDKNFQAPCFRNCMTRDGSTGWKKISTIYGKRNGEYSISIPNDAVVYDLFAYQNISSHYNKPNTAIKNFKKWLVRAIGEECGFQLNTYIDPNKLFQSSRGKSCIIGELCKQDSAYLNITSEVQKDSFDIPRVVMEYNDDLDKLNFDAVPWITYDLGSNVYRKKNLTWASKYNLERPSLFLINKRTGEIFKVRIPKVDVEKRINRGLKLIKFAFERISDQNDDADTRIKRFAVFCQLLRRYKNIAEAINLSKRYSKQVIDQVFSSSVDPASVFYYTSNDRTNDLLNSKKSYVMLLKQIFQYEFDFEQFKRDKTVTTLIQYSNIDQKKLGANLVPKTDVIVLDVDNLGGTNSIDGLNMVRSKYNIDDDSIMYIEYGCLGSKGFHVYVKINEVIDQDQLRVIKNEIESKSNESGFKVEVRLQNQNTVLPFGCDYFPFNIKHLDDQNEPALLDSSEYHKVVDRVLNCHGVTPNQTITAVILKRRTSTKTKAGRPRLNSDRLVPSKWSKPDKYVQIVPCSGKRRTKLDTIIQPFTLGNSNKEMYNQISWAVENGYSKTAIVDKIMSNRDNPNATARVYNEPKFNRATFEALYDKIAKTKPRWSNDQQDQSNDNDSLVETVRQVPVDFQSGLNYVSVPMLRCLTSASKSLCEVFAKNFERKYVAKRRLFKQFAKLVVPFFGGCFIGRTIHEFHKPATSNNFLKYVPEMSGTPVSNVYIKAMFDYIKSYIMSGNINHPLLDNVNVDRKYLADNIDKINSMTIEIGKWKKALLSTYNLKLVSYKGRRCFWASGFSQTVRFESYDQLCEHFNQLFSRHSKNLRIKCDILNKEYFTNLTLQAAGNSISAFYMAKLYGGPAVFYKHRKVLDNKQSMIARLNRSSAEFKQSLLNQFVGSSQRPMIVITTLVKVERCNTVSDCYYQQALTGTRYVATNSATYKPPPD